MTKNPILVVDDNTEIREGLCRAFDSEGFSVETATSGREALDRLEAGLRPCAIVMDLMMPVMNGVDFRTEQLKNADYALIPVITYSGMAGARLHVQAFRGQCSSQPNQINSIVALVRQHCVKAAPTRH